MSALDVRSTVLASYEHCSDSAGTPGVIGDEPRRFASITRPADRRRCHRVVDRCIDHSRDQRIRLPLVERIGERLGQTVGVEQHVVDESVAVVALNQLW